MKKILLILLLFLAVQVKAQDSTELTVKGVYEDVKIGFKELVDNLQGPAKHVYAVFIYQQKVKATVRFSIFLFCLISSVILIRHWNIAKWDSKSNGYHETLSVIGCLFTVFTIIYFFVAAFALGKLMNPEYYAIKDIINLFKSNEY
jgi:hypothetical protein